ncbi:MAG TPA: hypothetical protein VD886_04350, partial [Herpetosiphonaceae bacterium]|nr:hypothetical protein [Herpetosiphonaceae bacterium]
MAISVSAHQPTALQFARAGLLAIKAGDYRAGSVLLNRAVRLDPTLSEAWRWLGALHSGARRAICLEWARRTNPYATIPLLPTPVAPAAAAAARPAHRRRRAGRHLRLASGGVMLATALAVGGFQIAYADRVYPGVEALGVSLSGLSPDAARQAIAPRLTAWGEQKLILSADKRSWSVRFKELAGFSPDALASSAFALGRDGDLASRMMAQGGGLIGHQSVPAPAL